MEINVKFQPPYKTFINRMVVRLIKTVLISILLVFIGNNISQSVSPIVWLLLVLVAAASFFVSFRRNVVILKSIAITNSQCVLELVKYDKPYKTITLDTKQVNIKVTEAFRAAPGHTFDLVIDAKDDKGIYRNIYTQRPGGSWNLGLFKQVYINYCDAVGKTAYVSSLHSYHLITRLRLGYVRPMFTITPEGPSSR